MRNVELLNKFVAEENISRKELEGIVGVGPSQVCQLINGKASWTRKVCDNLNRHFITDEFVPCAYDAKTNTYKEWTPPKEPKKNTSANKYNIGDRVICLHDCKIHEVENVKFIKKRQEWVYYLEGDSDFVYENYLIDYKPKFNIGDKVLYDNDNAVVVDVIFEKKCYLYSILVDNYYAGRYGILVEDYELEPFIDKTEKVEEVIGNITAEKIEDSIISDGIEQVEKEKKEMTKSICEMNNTVREDVEVDEVVDEPVVEEPIVEVPTIDKFELPKNTDNKDALKKIILGIVDDLLKLI